MSPEKLSAFDAMFLAIEGGGMHMHVAGLLQFDAAPLSRPDGSLDVERIRNHIEASLPALPHFHQRIEYIPVLNHPAWVDDDRFDLRNHVTHEKLPAPGSEAALKRRVGELCGERLDRKRPLWQITIFEGLPDGRFALLFKVHHCIVDGVSGLAVLSVLLRLTPESEAQERVAFKPRRSADSLTLMRQELDRRIDVARSLIGRLKQTLSKPGEARRVLGKLIDGGGRFLRSSLLASSPTMLNPVEISPERHVDLVELDLAEIRALKQKLGVTVNDVVLAVVAGAVRSYMEGHGAHVDGIDFRAVVPVSLHDVVGSIGNKVSALIVPLPVGTSSPLERVRLAAESMVLLKQTEQASAVELGKNLSELIAPTLWPYAIRQAMMMRPYNVLVSNVPGPQLPLYLLGARMLSVCPILPLNLRQGLGIAVFSYDGRLFWGLLSDPKCVPDLDKLATAVRRELEVLRAATQTEPAASSSPTPTGDTAQPQLEVCTN